MICPACKARQHEKCHWLKVPDDPQSYNGCTCQHRTGGNEKWIAKK